MNARSETVRYHSQYYAKHRLFRPGSWLADPPEIIKSALDQFPPSAPLRVLDIGAGVGRNAIPIARRIAPSGGIVDCIDLLPLAVEKLRWNAGHHGVADAVEARCADVEVFPIPAQSYDLIISYSCIEHVSSAAALQLVLERMRGGTKPGGCNLIVINTAVKEKVLGTGEERRALLETNLKTDEAEKMLREAYRSWRILQLQRCPWQETIVRDTEHLLWTTTAIEFLTRSG